MHYNQEKKSKTAISLRTPFPVNRVVHCEIQLVFHTFPYYFIFFSIEDFVRIVSSLCHKSWCLNKIQKSMDVFRKKLSFILRTLWVLKSNYY